MEESIYFVTEKEFPSDRKFIVWRTCSFGERQLIRDLSIEYSLTRFPGLPLFREMFLKNFERESLEWSFYHFYQHFSRDSSSRIVEKYVEKSSHPTNLIFIYIKKNISQVKKAAKKEEGLILQQKLQEQRDTNSHINYGLGHVSMTLRFRRSKMSHWRNGRYIHYLKSSNVLKCLYKTHLIPISFLDYSAKANLLRKLYLTVPTRATWPSKNQRTRQSR